MNLLISAILSVLLVTLSEPTLARQSADVPGTRAPVPTVSSGEEPSRPSIALGRGDTVSLHVFDQPDMDGTVTVGDDGTVRVPLVGPVDVAGLSPAEAGLRIERALRNGKFLVSPHVTVTLTKSVSQLVSVLGEVTKPGRYPVTTGTTIFQLLAEAGGMTPAGADAILLIRSDPSGREEREVIDLKGYMDSKVSMPSELIKPGDSVFVPQAPQFYIYGEVREPNEYRLEPGMTVVQAIARAGGLTTRGSDRRIDIIRRSASGHERTFRAKQGEIVQPNDVIHVNESIF